MSTQRPSKDRFSNITVTKECLPKMVLLTITKAILEGLEKVLRHEKTSNPTKSNSVTAALQKLDCEEEQKVDNGAHKSGDKEKVEHITVAYAQKEGEPSLESPKIGDPISHLQILYLSQKLKELDPTSQYHLDDLLRGSQVYIPPKPLAPEPTSEYKALMARLRREAEERSYTQLTSKNPAAAYSKAPLTSAANAFKATEAYMDNSADDETTYADIDRQMTLIINVLVSIIACSAGLWIVSRWWSTPARLALSFGGSILVAMAEVAIYFGYIRRVKEAIKEEKKVVEVKEVVRSWAVGKGVDDEVPDEKATLIQPEQEKEAPRRRHK